MTGVKEPFSDFAEGIAHSGASERKESEESERFTLMLPPVITQYPYSWYANASPITEKELSEVGTYPFGYHSERNEQPRILWSGSGSLLESLPEALR